MTNLWQVKLEVLDGAELVAEMLDAALEAEGLSIHQEDDSAPWSVILLTAKEPDESRLKTALQEASRLTGQILPTPETEPVPDLDWLAENRKSFPPLDIGQFWIYGGHINAPVPRDKIGIKLDTGQAFGSGTHATTYGCIKMLEKHCPDGPSLSIADVGCGSGILAMAAASIRPDAKIIAVDNDSIAVKIAHENARKNNLQISFDLSDGVQAKIVQEHAPYAMILANILPTPLIEMSDSIAKCLAGDGVLILSGLLENQQEEVAAAYIDLGLKIVDTMTYNGWATIVMGVEQ